MEAVFLPVVMIFALSLFLAVRDNEREISRGRALLISAGLFSPVVLVVVKFLLKTL